MTELWIKCGCGRKYIPENHDLQTSVVETNDAVSFSARGTCAARCPDCNETPGQTGAVVIVA